MTKTKKTSSSKTRRARSQSSKSQSLQIQKPVLLFIHGLRGDHNGLRHIYQLLEDDFQIFAPDLPGYGDNPANKPASLDSYLIWLKKYCETLPAKPILVGHSMGSILISHFAKRYPETLDKKIVLLSPVLRNPSKQALFHLPYYLLRGTVSIFPKKTQYKILASHKISWAISHFLTFDKSKQAFIDEEHYKYSGRFNSTRSMLSDIKISMTAHTEIPLKKQNLIIIGEKDQLVSAVKTKRQAKLHKIPCQVIPDTGHLLNYETPELVAKYIQDFATKH